MDIRLGDFLDKGSIVRTKHCESPNWVTNVVYGLNDESIEIDMGLEKNYIENIIMIGDTMKCKYTTSDHEYTVTGWVSKISTGCPQSITIKVQRIERFDNKRDSYRYDVYLSSVVKVKREDGKGIFSILTNISLTGAAFIVRENIGKLLNFDESTLDSKIVTIEAYISPERIIVFEGEIVRKCDRDKGVEYGVRIFDMDMDNEKQLNGFINELAIRDKEFYNKRSG